MKPKEEVDEKKKPFCCSICDKAFAAKQTLERHFANLHKHEHYLSTNHGEEVDSFDLEKLECKTCEGSFATKSAFVHHMKQFHAIEIEI